MFAVDPSTEASPRPCWRDVLKLVALWIVGCSLAGVLAATFSGQFGSVVFVIVGVFVGLSGAISHCILVQLAAFRRSSNTVKTITLWIGAMTIPLAWTVLGALDSTHPVGPNYVIAFSGGIAAFALVASISITLYETRWSA